MSSAKLSFLTIDFIRHLNNLDENTPAQWGKMNVVQMIEHMSDSVRIANGKDPHQIITTEEKLKPMKDFLMSEKDFRPNTPNSLMSETPAPIRNKSKEDAIRELQKELNDFVNHFKMNVDARIKNPFFGELNFEEWVQLLHKHSIHHLRQFGADV